MLAHALGGQVRVPVDDGGEDGVVFGKTVVLEVRAEAGGPPAAPDHGSADGVQGIEKGEQKLVPTGRRDGPVEVVVPGLVHAPLRAALVLRMHCSILRM